MRRLVWLLTIKRPHLASNAVQVSGALGGQSTATVGVLLHHLEGLERLQHLAGQVLTIRILLFTHMTSLNRTLSEFYFEWRILL